MGCHILFYRKLERTQEEAKQSCLVGLRDSEQLNLSILKDRNYGDIDWSDYSDENLIHSDAVLKRQIRMVENDLCQRAVWNHQNDERPTKYIDGKGLYISDTEFYDVFRVTNFPKIKLFSLDETLSYINNIENDCATFENTIIRLITFWHKYPDGFIRFG